MSDLNLKGAGQGQGGVGKGAKSLQAGGLKGPLSPLHELEKKGGLKASQFLVLYLNF